MGAVMDMPPWQQVVQNNMWRVGRAKPECTLVLGLFMQINAFISCVFILKQPLKIQRLDWVGLEPSFLRNLPTPQWGKKGVPHLNNLTVTCKTEYQIHGTWKDTWQWHAGGQCSADGRGWRAAQSQTQPWCGLSETAGRERSSGSFSCRCSCSPTDSDGRSPAEWGVHLRYCQRRLKYECSH